MEHRINYNRPERDVETPLLNVSPGALNIFFHGLFLKSTNSYGSPYFERVKTEVCFDMLIITSARKGFWK